MSEPTKLDVYALSRFTRVELTDADIAIARNGNVSIVLTRDEWVALVELLLPRLTEAARAELTAEVARGYGTVHKVVDATGHTA